MFADVDHMNLAGNTGLATVGPFSQVDETELLN